MILTLFPAFANFTSAPPPFAPANDAYQLGDGIKRCLRRLGSGSGATPLSRTVGFWG